MTTQNNIVSKLSKLRPGSTFLTLKGYRNDHSEVSDYSIVFNISYKNSLLKSIANLKDIVPSTDLEAKAKKELIDGYQTSLSKLETVPFEELDDNYVHFKDENGNYIKGVKYHKESDTVHLYGFVVHKKVLIPGIYPEKNKRALTIAKDKLRKNCPVSKFRQFKLLPEQLDFISVNKLTILPE
jgi:hypothetical protein